MILLINGKEYETVLEPTVNGCMNCAFSNWSTCPSDAQLICCNFTLVAPHNVIFREVKDNTPHNTDYETN